jgi:hypothetical protein
MDFDLAAEVCPKDGFTPGVKFAHPGVLEAGHLEAQLDSADAREEAAYLEHSGRAIWNVGSGLPACTSK